MAKSRHPAALCKTRGAFLKALVGDIAEHSGAHGIGEFFVKMCEAFCGCGEKVAEEGPKVIAHIAAAAPAATVGAASLLAIPMAGPVAISLCIFGVSVYMKRAREAKEEHEREAMFAEIMRISDAVSLAARQKAAETELAALVEDESPVWAKLRDADDATFAKVLADEIRDALPTLGLATQEGQEAAQIYLAEMLTTLDDVKTSVGEVKAAVNEVKASVMDANQKIDAHGEKIGAKVDANGDILARLLEIAERKQQSEADLKQRLTDEIERKYGDQLAQERDARQTAERAAQSLLDVRGISGIEASLREKGPQAIIDGLLHQATKAAIVTVETHRKVADWAYLIGNIDQAAASLKIVLAHYPTDLDATNKLGQVYVLAGQIEAANAQFQRVLDIAGQYDEIQAVVHTGRGLALLEDLDFKGAEAEFKEALRITGHYATYHFRDMTAMASNYGNLGIVYRARGALDEAENMHRKALDIYRRRGDLSHIAGCYCNLGNVLSERGQLRDAFRLHLTFYRLDRRYPGRIATHYVAANFKSMSEIYIKVHDLNQAAKALEESLTINLKLGRTKRIADQARDLGHLLYQLSDFSGASANYRLAGARFETLKRPAEAAFMHGQAGVAAKRCADFAGARQAWTQSRSLFEACRQNNQAGLLTGWISKLPVE